MPNRILRDWTESEKVDNISTEAEILFVRIMMKTDYRGLAKRHPKLIKALCFPLKTNLDYRLVDNWVKELIDNDFISELEIDGKIYISISDTAFGRQRLPKNEWLPMVRAVFKRDNYTCKYCGQYGGKLEADHIVAFSKGGEDTMDNLTTACRRCNSQKKDKSVEEFLKIRACRN